VDGVAHHHLVHAVLAGQRGDGLEVPGGAGPHGIQSYRPSDNPDESRTFKADDGRTHFNLLGWNGQGGAPKLFPERGST
jgi:nitrate reductase beta subunit